LAINKWALGISDTYALGVLAEQTGLDVPIVVDEIDEMVGTGDEDYGDEA
jgi:hypothetical protein